MKRAVCVLKHAMGKGEIAMFRDEKLASYATDEISGTLVLGEGNLWVQIEGDDTVIDDELTALSIDNRFTDMDVLHQVSLSSRDWSRLYFYNELDKPTANPVIP